MGEENSAGEDMLFAVMLIMVTGTFVYYNLSKFKLPYTVIMFLYGMVLGLTSLQFNEWYDKFFEVFMRIPPNLLFHIFLPVLIFEGSYGVKPHALKNVFGMAIILASLGLIINTVIVGFATQFFVYTDWNIYAVMLLGSILSATDPVAVVTLLKDLGVDASLTAVIDAEALMNDGTAIICFKLLLPAAISGGFTDSWSSLLLQCVRLTVGAAFFGLLVGFVMLKVLRQCEAHELASTIQTIAFAYMSFYMADVWLETSGVLMLFTAGTFLAHNYPSKFPGSHHSMLNSTWHFLVHSLNTIIFCLVGIVIARRSFGSDFNVLVLGTMVFMYVVCTIARVAMISMLLPLLNISSRFTLTWREVALQVHGGLRGGVATILVLIVAGSELSPEIQKGFLHITCGIVVLTLIVNAATAGWVVRTLDLHAKPQNRLTQMTVGVQQLRHVVNHALTEAKSDDLLRSANWPMVHQVASSLENPYEEMPSIPEDDLAAFIAILMRTFKTDVFRQRDHNRCTEDVCKTLTALAQQSIMTRTLSSIASKVPEMEYPFYIRWLESTSKADIVKRLVMRLKKEHDTWFFGLLLCYGEALEQIEQVLPEYVQTAEQGQIAERWLGRERQEMSQLVSLFQNEKPQATVAVFTAIAATQVMKEAEEAVHTLHHHGFSEYDTSSMAGAIAAALRPVASLPPEIAAPTPEEMFQLSAIGKGVSELTTTMLSRNWNVETVAPDTEIMIGECVGVVIKGIAAVVSTHDSKLIPGSVWGTESYVIDGRHAPPVLATSEVTYLRVSSAAIRGLMADDPMFAQTMRATASKAIASELLVQLCRFASTDEAGIDGVVEGGMLITAPHDQYTLPVAEADDSTTFFIQGRDMTGIVGPAMPPFVVPKCGAFRWAEGTLLFRVDSQLGDAAAPSFASGHRRRTNRPTVPLQAETSVTMSPSPTSEAAPLVANASEREVEPVYLMSLPQLAFKPQECVTPVPYFNRFLVLYTVAMEQLCLVAQQYSNSPTYHKRQAVQRATDSTLQFLSRFCVNLFPKEELVYRAARLPERAAHRESHREFQRQVGQWLERRATDADDLIHVTVLEEMAAFASRHFPTDNRDGQACLSKLDAAQLQGLTNDAAFQHKWLAAGDDDADE